MDLIIEFIGEFILEGIIELIKNKKISKWIRYPILIVISAFYSLIILALAIIMIKAFSKNILFGVCLLIIEIILTLGIICIIKNMNKKDN